MAANSNNTKAASIDNIISELTERKNGTIYIYFLVSCTPYLLIWCHPSDSILCQKLRKYYYLNINELFNRATGK